MSSVRGWWFPIDSRKAHYFNNQRISLCKKWMAFGEMTPDDTNDISPDNCMLCRKEVERLREQERQRAVIDGREA